MMPLKGAAEYSWGSTCSGRTKVNRNHEETVSHGWGGEEDAPGTSRLNEGNEKLGSEGGEADEAGSRNSETQ